MNNTKWKKLIKALSENEFYEPEIRFRYIGDIYPETGFSHVYWNEVIEDGLEKIEWIEINPFKKTFIGELVKNKEEDFTNQLENELKKVNIPYSKVEQNFRVYGYTKN